MDLSTQETIKRLADEHGADALIVLLGAPDAESAGIAAERTKILEMSPTVEPAHGPAPLSWREST